jgi:hypothetical protein
MLQSIIQLVAYKLLKSSNANSISNLGNKIWSIFFKDFKQVLERTLSLILNKFSTYKHCQH